MSKGGFPLSGTRYLAQSMQAFDNEILKNLPNKYDSREDLISDLAIVHRELLFIHPAKELLKTLPK